MLRNHPPRRGLFRSAALLVIFAPFGLVLFGACAVERRDADRALFAALDTIASPASAGSAEPNLTVGPDGRVYLTWIEPAADSAHALRMAAHGAEGWSAPVTIASGRHWFVNWADFPSLVALPNGRLAAHWLQRSGEGTYAYDVRIAQSFDGGVTWSAGVVPHRDGTESEHGFASLFPIGDALGAIWLDGRKYARPEGARKDEMTLAFTTLARDDTLGAERRVDDRICDCCQTSAAITARGPVVVYRDRSPDEIRDIAIVRFVDGAWSEPRLVHADGWKIAACPVNGPAVAARGDHVAVAWFAAPNDSARVQVAFSSDAGATFGTPARVDAGAPAGRVDVELDDDGAAYVSWIERSGGDIAEVRVRRVDPDGTPGPVTAIARSSAARASGFPRMARAGRDLWFAWTVPGTPSAVRVARARLTSTIAAR